MRPGEVARVLATCIMFDARKVEKADIQAWTAAIGDLDFTDATEAVIRHYRESTEWIKPAHIRRGVKRIEKERRALELALEPNPVLTQPSPFEQDVNRHVRMKRGAADVAAVLEAVMQRLAARSETSAVPAMQRLRAATAGPDWNDADGEVRR